MYELYLDWCNANSCIPAKKHKYREVFNYSYNISFHPPLKDTCAKCDRFDVQLKLPDSDSNVHTEIIEQRQLHPVAVEETFERRKADKNISRARPDIKAITFDLQQTLPTPHLQTSVAFYKRQLWTYNLGLHDYTTDDATMFMWPEGTAGRGSHEIASCLLKYCQSLPGTVSKLIAYSDSCAGQNKNYNIVLMWLHITQVTNVATIDHKFMVPGHSFLASDSDFSVIEKAKHGVQYVYTPSDWYSLVHGARKKPAPFTVVEMKSDDFYSTSNVAEHTIRKNTDEDGKAVVWRNIRWIRVEKEEPTVMKFKTTLQESVPFQRVDLQRRVKRGRQQQWPTELTQLHQTPPLIAAKKYNDLMTLLDYIPPIYHQFY